MAKISKGLCGLTKGLLIILGLYSTFVGAMSLTSPKVIRGSCRLFLDTADVEEWNTFLPTGMFYGVTTNPTILERSGVPCTVSDVRSLAETALKSCEEFMCQAWGGSTEKLYETGIALHGGDDRIVIKVPSTYEGVQAATQLMASGVRVCMTAGYASHQAMVAASVGAEYYAPYLGRMTDAGKDGMQECATMHQSARGLGSHTRILVASIRDASSMVKLSSQGLDTFTFSPDVARQLFYGEQLTIDAAKDFEDAAKRNS